MKYTKSKRPKFLDDFYASVQKGDMTVFEEAFTSDFRLTMPETRLLSPDGSLYGLLQKHFPVM